jgi:hypothetical protein
MDVPFAVACAKTPLAVPAIMTPPQQLGACRPSPLGLAAFTYDPGQQSDELALEAMDARAVQEWADPKW